VAYGKKKKGERENMSTGEKEDHEKTFVRQDEPAGKGKCGAEKKKTGEKTASSGGGKAKPSSVGGRYSAGVQKEDFGIGRKKKKIRKKKLQTKPLVESNTTNGRSERNHLDFNQEPVLGGKSLFQRKKRFKEGKKKGSV